MHAKCIIIDRITDLHLVRDLNEWSFMLKRVLAIKILKSMRHYAFKNPQGRSNIYE